MKKLNLILAGLIVILIVFLAILFMKKSPGGGGSKTTATPTPTPYFIPMDEKIKVNITKIKAGKAVNLEISGLLQAGIKSIEYELTYETGEGLLRGVNSGSKAIDVAGKDIFEREVVLGTCSRNVCKYDEGIKKINLVVKFNSDKGTSAFQKEFEI